MGAMDVVVTTGQNRGSAAADPELLIKLEEIVVEALKANGCKPVSRLDLLARFVVTVQPELVNAVGRVYSWRWFASDPTLTDASRQRAEGFQARWSQRSSEMASPLILAFDQLLSRLATPDFRVVAFSEEGFMVGPGEYFVPK